MSPSRPDDAVPATTREVGSPVSLTAISPPEQGDAISGLTLTVGGVGAAGAPDLPGANWPQKIGDEDAWSVAVDAASGWYVLLSQDCDIVRSADDEPTVQVVPLVAVSREEWVDLVHNEYSSRRFAYPGEKLQLDADVFLAADLAWVTSIIKGSLTADGVAAVRPLTGPQKERFAEWVATRFGRAPFPNDLVECVLDPCYDVRARLLKRFEKARAGGGTAPLEARAVGAAARWYARVDGRLVHIVGELTGPTLSDAGFVEPNAHDLDVDELAAAQARLEAEVVKRMNVVAPRSGFEARVLLVDLATMRASQFREFSLLVR